MTIDGFLDALRALKLTWQLQGSDIRWSDDHQDGYPCCPILAVGRHNKDVPEGRTFANCNYHLVADAIDLDRTDANLIAAAADGSHRPAAVLLRQRLLAACGLGGGS